MLPLTGITVISLEQAVAAPFATRQLADLGARVIKIERPGCGDCARAYDKTVRGMSSHFVWLNRSKESFTLDLKHREAVRIMHKLFECEHVDVFVQNISSGSVEMLELGGEMLAERYPRLIVCNISGYGDTGPYHNKRAYDLLVQGEVGLLSVTGTTETPSKVGIPIADIAAGMYAFTGILTSLYRRERTGKGNIFDVTLFEALGEWMGYPAYFTAYGGAHPSRTGANHATIAPYGPFQTGDGKQVNLGIQNGLEWERFCVIVLEKPEMVNDKRFHRNVNRVAHCEELYSAINAVFSQLTAEQVIERLERAQIPHARLNTMQEFWDHPQLAARQRWQDVESPVGMLKALQPPVTMRDVEPRMDRVPDLGEQTDEILISLGYSDEYISQLRADGAI
jgi:itaconate CoA-transferase